MRVCRLAFARAAAALVVCGLAFAQEAPNLAVETPPAARVTPRVAMQSAVKYLLDTQNPDGSFGQPTSGRVNEIMASVPGSLMAFRSACTALCWMGLHDALPQVPEGAPAARRALAWLAHNARVRRPNGMEMYNIWALAYGLRAVSEAITSKAEGASEADLRAEGDAIIKALINYQVPDGGFTYYDFAAHTFQPSDSSMSFTTATVLVGLDRARVAGFHVPERLVERAVKSLRTCRKVDGSYLYGPYLKYVPRMGVNQPKGSSLRTQSNNLALYLWKGGVTLDDCRAGLVSFEDCRRFAIAGLRRPVPHESWYQVSGYFYLYGHQYAAMILERLTAEDQRHFWPVVVRGVLQTREPDGSYWDYPLYGYHKAYGTGYALMTLARCPPEIAATINAPPPATK